jgi:hypothetical protein
MSIFATVFTLIFWVTFYCKCGVGDVEDSHDVGGFKYAENCLVLYSE